jgi:hypothetical protein
LNIQGLEKHQIDTELTKPNSTSSCLCNFKNFNTDFCILIRHELTLGVKRFLVWDFKTKKSKHSFLAGHGFCDYVGVITQKKELMFNLKREVLRKKINIKRNDRVQITVG